MTTLQSEGFVRGIIKNSQNAEGQLKQRWPSMNKPTSPARRHSARLDIDGSGKIFVNKNRL